MQEWLDIFIKPTDEALAKLVVSKDNYLIPVVNHLNHKQFYEKLPEDQMEEFSKGITRFLVEMV